MKAGTVCVVDPGITEAVVLGGRVVRAGDRVKHYAQRYTGCATATVRGFCNVGTEQRPWIKVLVATDKPDDFFGSFPNGWDWDRTEVASDIDLDLAPSSAEREGDVR